MPVSCFVAVICSHQANINLSFLSLSAVCAMLKSTSGLKPSSVTN